MMSTSPGRALISAGAALLLATAACAADPGPSSDEEGSGAADEPARMRPVIQANNAFYYYADLDAAWRFYTGVMGFETAADFGFAKILRVGPTSYLTLVNAEDGMHAADEPKTVTLAVVTDEVEGWWEYLSAAGVPMRGEFAPAEGRPHVGFVAVDPEGYYLEFERFETHEENDRLMPALSEVEALYPATGLATERPANLGVRGTVLWLYYQDTAAANAFYTDLLGEGPIVDQGWAWAYRTSASGYLGIVDGARGLHQATDDKGVTVSLFTPDIEAWFEYLGTQAGFEFRSTEVGDESGRVRTFVGYDPEGYFLEWDTFIPADGNEELLRQLAAAPAR
jgi:catechol 2,3-dioxygenase-like lactoylglutathione lyase family enzyme